MHLCMFVHQLTVKIILKNACNLITSTDIALQLGVVVAAPGPQHILTLNYCARTILKMLPLATGVNIISNIYHDLLDRF